MAETPAHRVDRVIPRVPVCQWVLIGRAPPGKKATGADHADANRIPEPQCPCSPGRAAHSQKVASKASVVFEPAPPAPGSRYQNWKLQVLPTVISAASSGGAP